MPGPASRNLKQVITYWAPEGNNDFGMELFAAPIKISGRWSERAEAVRKSTGEEITSRAIVFVDRDLESDGYLALGDFTAEDDPRTLGGDAYIIQAFASLPDVRNMEQERRAYL